MHYTIINLTRFGDLLQTACTVSALKKSGCHSISLICLQQFADAAAFIPRLDHVKAFSGAKLLKNLSANSFSQWTQAFQDLKTWTEEYLNEYGTECIINLTPTIKTRLFTKLLSQLSTLRNGSPVQEIGFCVNEYGFSRNSNIWTSYTQAVTQNRSGSPYNLIDEFRSMLGLAPEVYQLNKPSPELCAQSKQLLTEFSRHCPNINGFVGFQLGASSSMRQWSIERFAELAALLWEKRRYIPVLLGSKEEIPLGENFSELTTVPHFNYIGKSSLQELGAMLCNLTALVSNDTGTLHLATGLGVPVVGIYLATAQVWDTGPYGANQICLEPQLACHPCNFNTPCPNSHICQKSISAQTVFEALCIRLGEKISPCKEGTARIWQGCFQEDGFINYKPLHNDSSLRTVWMQCQRLFYKNLLFKIQTGQQEKYPSNLTVAALPSPVLSEMEKLQTYLLLVREQAVLLQKMPSLKTQEKFLVSTRRLSEFLRQTKFFIPLSLLFEQLLQDNAQDMESIIHFFDTLKEELSVFAEFLSPKN